MVVTLIVCVATLVTQSVELMPVSADSVALMICGSAKASVESSPAPSAVMALRTKRRCWGARDAAVDVLLVCVRMVMA